MSKIKLGKIPGWDIPIVGFKPEDAGLTREQVAKFDQFLAHRCRNNKGQPIINFTLVYSGTEPLDLEEYHELPIGSEIKTPNFDLVYAYYHEKISTPPSINDWKTVPKFFPYHKLILNPGGNYCLRYFVSPDGDDNNSGKNWSNAKRQIQAVINDLPQDLFGYTIYIIVKPGTYSEVYSQQRINNGALAFIYAGDWVSETNGDWALWCREDSNETFTNTDPVIIANSGTDPAWLINGIDLYIGFYSGNYDYKGEFWTENYKCRHGAWVIDGTNGTSWSLFVMYGGVEGQALWIDTMKIILGGTTGIAVEINSEVYLFDSLQLIGGDGTASTNNGDWIGAMIVYNGGNYLQSLFGGTVNYHPDYLRPSNSSLHITDIKQALFCSLSVDTDGSRNTRILSNNIIYVDDNRSYGKTEFKISAYYHGKIHYHDDYVTLTGENADIILKDLKTNITKTYFSKDFYDDGTHLYYKGVQID